MSVTVQGHALRGIGIGPRVLQELPTAVLSEASSITEATLSFNSLTDLSGLSLFAGQLKVLVLDNNNIVSLKSLPQLLPSLNTLWLNNNALADLEETLNTIAARCPALQYLSLLRNPCCPNELVGKNEHEYARYRIYVKFRIPTLCALDAEAISDSEAKTARERGQFYQTVAAKEAVAEPPAPAEGIDANDETRAAGAKWADKDPQRPAAEAIFSNQRHFYSGKTSEGNRFIGNDML